MATEAPKGLGRVRQQIEFYFGDANFRRDRFLRTKAAENEEGFVPIDVLLTFNRLKKLTESAEDIAKAVEGSDQVVVSEDKKSIRRAKPLPDSDDAQARTLYVKGFPLSVTLERLEAFFGKHGTVGYITMRRYKTSRDFKGSVFVEFKEQADADKFLETKPAFDDTPLAEVKKIDDFLGEKKAQRAGPGHKNGAGAGAGAAPAEEERTFEKGKLMRITNIGDTETREAIKAALEDAGKVQFVDFSVGKTEATVRFNEANEATEAFTKLGGKVSVGESKDCAIRVLEGEEEETYWKGIWQGMDERRARSASNRKRHGGGRRGGGNQRKRQAGRD